MEIIYDFETSYNIQDVDDGASFFLVSFSKVRHNP